MSTDPAEQLVRILSGRGETLAAAESCTGGLINAAITEVSGSSAVLWGGVVSYANDAKTGVLGVDPGMLAREGAVSGAVAKAMAWGMRVASGADWTVSTTGIAGPDGGTSAKPVGTVWIAWCNPGGEINAREFHFKGNRKEVRKSAVQEALRGLLDSVDSKPS